RSGAREPGAAELLGRLQERLRQTDVPPDSSILVVDAAGRIVARRTDPEKWVGQSALDSTAVREALRLREGVAQGDFVDGRRRLSGFAPLQGAPWVVVVGMPLDEATGALRREMLWSLGRLAIAAACAGVVAWVMGRRLTRPIRHLAATAQALAAGDLSARASEGGATELASLAGTLNGMAAALEMQITELRAAGDRERVAAEHALVELRRLHSEFIAVAAHELRTPVAAAKSYAELLLREDGEMGISEAERRQSLDRLNAVCDRLSRLVRSLLGASRIQTGSLEIARVPFDLAAVVRRIAGEVAGASPTHDVVVGHGLRHARVAMGDAERIEDVLVNLLVNATKYSPAGSVVTVDAAVRGGVVEVLVRDEGPGVPEEERALVFDRFTRGARATDAGVAAGGVGLGLYIARAYVEAMGGAIGVRPAEDGRGATFWFTIPTAERAPSEQAA
ncbi:MAG TPA: ATP-binding protein, partial [Chloroflexota bacterium]|nr:ATP-binding protein [Chloroflexota bacterium]